MALSPLDWAIVAVYVVFAVWVGTRFSRRASRSADDFFLSGRTLPWWLAGTSMVATTFASDTPLVVTGWVRGGGIWRNWIWWSFALGTALTTFFFARWWRRGEIMTTAELSELRYGGRGARSLRGFLGLYHSLITNTIVLVWVTVAARKTMEALLPIDRTLAVVLCCAVALGYSLLAGLWGVVVTDALQFGMAMLGAILLAVLAVGAVGGLDGLHAAVERGVLSPETVAFAPSPGPGGWLDPAGWSSAAASFCVYLGIAWWAKDGVDGGGLVVQRILASRDERHGVLATLWYLVATWAVRPWPWILVALASLIALPGAELRAGDAGTVRRVAAEAGALEIELEPATGAPRVERWSGAADWAPVPLVAEGDRVVADQLLARTDDESAYPVMMRRLLPAGLLGLMVASLVAAFMSTVDTHLNLASSYFVNDVYRRFLVRAASARHYVLVGRAALVALMVGAGAVALLDLHIGELFGFFLSFLGGVGPVYLLRWFWWRVRASTEIAAMVASSVAATWLAADSSGWRLGPLSPGGELGYEGRLCLVVAISMACALVSMAATRAPDPATLVPFYRRVRPLGAWGPVRALLPEPLERQQVLAPSLGALGAALLTYGLLFGVGYALLGRWELCGAWSAAAAAGAALVAGALRRLRG